MYYFVHGYPTYEVGSWMEVEHAPACGNANCLRLMDEVWPQMRKAGESWADMQALECDVCRECQSLF